MKKTVTAPDAPKSVGPYSQAVLAGGFIYVSGQLPINPETGKLVASGITEQTKQVIKNIEAILKAADYNLNDVVQTTVYLSSMKHFDEFNLEYAKHFTQPYPARATVACELKAGADIEVSAVAYRQ